MELIIRKLLLEDSIDRGFNSPTYGTLTATSFYINVMLIQTIDDMGMFTDIDYIPNPNLNPNPIDFQLRLTGKNESDYYTTIDVNVSGLTESNLDEVKSYAGGNQYRLNFDVNSEIYSDYKGNSITGVNRITYLGDPITYVIDADKYDKNIGTTGQTSGILYRDYSGNGTTEVFYISQGWNERNVSLSALTKEEYLFGVTSVPEVNSDVFIDRGITPIFEKHLKLSEITNLGELARYGKGYFNITKQ